MIKKSEYYFNKNVIDGNCYLGLIGGQQLNSDGNLL